MKDYTKLTVVMCCQIFDRKSLAAIFGGNQRCSSPVDKIRNFDKKNVLVGCLVNMFRGNGRSYVGGYRKEFFMSRDVNGWASGVFWSTALGASFPKIERAMFLGI